MYFTISLAIACLIIAIWPYWCKWHELKYNSEWTQKSDSEAILFLASMLGATAWMLAGPVWISWKISQYFYNRSIDDT